MEAKLRRLPSCVLDANPAGTEVTLILVGLRVTSHVCLAEACRAWAAELQRRTKL